MLSSWHTYTHAGHNHCLNASRMQKEFLNINHLREFWNAHQSYQRRNEEYFILSGWQTDFQDGRAERKRM